jgi:hypothetical protein
VPSAMPVYRGVLDELSDEQAAEVVDGWATFLAPHTPLPEAAKDRIVAQSLGSPAFLEHWVRHWVATGSVEQVPMAVVTGMEAVRGEISQRRSREGSRAVFSRSLASVRRRQSDRQLTAASTWQTLLDRRAHSSLDAAVGSLKHGETNGSIVSELVGISSMLATRSEFHLADQTLSRALRLAKTASDEAAVLAMKVQVLVLAGRVDEASLALSSLERLSGDPLTCQPKLATHLARTYIATYGFPGLHNTHALVDSLALLLTRSDLADSARARIAVAIIKLDELVQHREAMAVAYSFLKGVTPENVVPSLLVHEGLMCFESLNGDPIRAVLHAEAIVEKVGLQPKTPRRVRLLGNAASAIAFAGDVRRALLLHEVALNSAMSIQSINETAFARNRFALCHFDYGDRREAQRLANEACEFAMRELNGMANASLFVAGALICAVEGNIEAASKGLSRISRRRDGATTENSPLSTLSLLSENSIRLAIASRTSQEQRDNLLRQTRQAILASCSRRPLDNCAAIVVRALASSNQRRASQEFATEYVARRGRSTIRLSRTFLAERDAVS